MGYTVELRGHDLDCKTKQDADQAAALVNLQDFLEVAPHWRSNPPHDDAWSLSVRSFNGAQWNNDHANRLWLALTPHMADGATIELKDEKGSHWRIRWNGGRVYEEYPQSIVWALERQITPACLEVRPVTDRSLTLPCLTCKTETPHVLRFTETEDPYFICNTCGRKHRASEHRRTL